MIRRLLSLLIVGMAAGLGAAQPLEKSQFALSPMAAPAPTADFHLIYLPTELTPGNAAVLHQRTLAMFVENQALLKELRSDSWNKLLTQPIEGWPIGEASGKVSMFRYLAAESDYAGRCRDCDWQIQGRPEGWGLLLPDIQGHRLIGSALAVKARHQIAVGDYPGAAKTLRSGFALGRHLSREPSSMIQVLVGVAITQMMLNQIETWIAQPNAPNLYWALTELPRPTSDIRSAVEEDYAMLERMLPWLSQVEGPPLSVDGMAAIDEKLRSMFDEFGMRKQDAAERLKAAALRKIAAMEARPRLLKSGYTAQQLDAMPSFQIAAVDTFREWRSLNKEFMRWINADALDHPGMAELSGRMNTCFQRIDRLIFRGLASGLAEGDYAGSIKKVALATKRIDRQIAALRVVEALRLHAADHEGKLPENLDAVTQVPVPLDPVHPKPFGYMLKDGVAELRAEPPKGQKESKTTALWWAISIKK